jgi:hypothetical protein
MHFVPMLQLGNLDLRLHLIELGRLACSECPLRLAILRLSLRRRLVRCGLPTRLRSRRHYIARARRTWPSSSQSSAARTASHGGGVRRVEARRGRRGNDGARHDSGSYGRRVEGCGGEISATTVVEENKGKERCELKRSWS